MNTHINEIIKELLPHHVNYITHDEQINHDIRVNQEWRVKTNDIIRALAKAENIGIERLKEEAKSNALKIEAYPRHLEEIEELKKENELLIKQRDAYFQYNSQLKTEFQHSQKELHDITVKWNKVIQEVEKMKENWKGYDKAHINERFEAGGLHSISEVLSILKPETKPKE